MKVGRNDLCPCGSGKKFKKCCIDKPEYSSKRVPPVSSEYAPLAGAMEFGFKALEAGDDERAANIWLEGWEWLLGLIEARNFTSLRAIDNAIRGELPEFVGNWVQDLEACLGNLAMRDESWAEKRLTMIRELLHALPETDAERLFNMREAEAETLFILGRPDEGDTAFAALVEDYPDSAWAYMGWGDMYSPAFFRDRWEKDSDRAREIYERGFNPQVVVDREEIEERIRLLEGES